MQASGVPVATNRVGQLHPVGVVVVIFKKVPVLGIVCIFLVYPIYFYCQD